MSESTMHSTFLRSLMLHHCTCAAVYILLCILPVSLLNFFKPTKSLLQCLCVAHMMQGQKVQSKSFVNASAKLVLTC